MTEETPTPRKKSCLRQLLLPALLAVGVVIVATELVGRFVLGLGDPPLSMADPEIEYLFRPSASYRRFGNDIVINRFSMRGDDFAAERTNPNELRIAVIGDSIVFGGAQVAQDDVGTIQLQRSLARRLDRPVVCANIAAGSWGPANMLAYVRKHGFFDADLLVVVVNSPDARDVPTFNPLTTAVPTRSPICAIEDMVWIFRRYASLTTPKPTPKAERDAKTVEGIEDFGELLDECVATGKPVVVLQHLKRMELVLGPEPGHDELARVARERDIPVFQLGPRLARAIEEGTEVYRSDQMHPNAAGQAILAEMLEEIVVDRLDLGDG
jgi:hypothetical protein